jgi:hypothetical protein
MSAGRIFLCIFNNTHSKILSCPLCLLTRSPRLPQQASCGLTVGRAAAKLKHILKRYELKIVCEKKMAELEQEDCCCEGWVMKRSWITNWNRRFLFPLFPLSISISLSRSISLIVSVSVDLLSSSLTPADILQSKEQCYIMARQATSLRAVS